MFYTRHPKINPMLTDVLHLSQISLQKSRLVGVILRVLRLGTV